MSEALVWMMLNSKSEMLVVSIIKVIGKNDLYSFFPLNSSYVFVFPFLLFCSRKE